RDDLSAVITDEARLEPDLLLVSGGINDGHRALITALADRRVGNGQNIVDLVRDDPGLRGLTILKSRIDFIEDYGDVIVDDAGDVAARWGHRDDRAGAGEVWNSIERDVDLLVR